LQTFDFRAAAAIGSGVGALRSLHTICSVNGAAAAGTNNPGNTTSGVLPVATDAGYTGTLDGGPIKEMSVWHTGAWGTFLLCDCVWAAGTFPSVNNVTYTITSPPSFSGRGSAVGAFAVYEAVTVPSTSPSISMTYTNSSGVTGRATTSTAPNPLSQRDSYHLGLQAGDAGIQKIESIIFGSTGSTQTGNVRIYRPLMSISVPFGYAYTKLTVSGKSQGSPLLYPTSALTILFKGSSTAVLPGSVIEVTSE
jgi:hypothetical protein